MHSWDSYSLKINAAHKSAMHLKSLHAKEDFKCIIEMFH